jgi:DNA-binding transcriptional LysR family regulator
VGADPIREAAPLFLSHPGKKYLALKKCGPKCIAIVFRHVGKSRSLKLKQKPRVVEEYDSFSGIISAVEAGTGVAIGADVFGHSFGNRVKLLHITPEPKPIPVGIVGTKGRLSSAAEKFWQCAKEAALRK